MSDRVKMILRLIVFLGVAVAIGAALYFTFFRGAPAVTPVDNGPGTVNTPGGLPISGAGNAGGNGGAGGNSGGGATGGTGTLPPSSVANGGATTTQLLTESAVLSPTITANNTVAYYDPADGRFYTMNNDGEAERMSEKQFPAAETVTFSDDATTAVLEFPDGSNVVYGFTSGKQITLPSHWEDFSFSGDSSQIASKSIGSDPSNRSIVITSVDGTKTEAIAALGDNQDKVTVNWSPTNNIVAFSRTGTAQSGFGRQQYYLIDTNGVATGTLIVEGSNFSAQWAPGGGNMVYSVADASNDYRASLWYADSEGDRNGDPRVRLGVETWIEKCTFASAAELYCAVPNEMVASGGANHSLVTSDDTLYRISLPSGKVTLVGYTAIPTQMKNLHLSSDGDILYYQDERGRLNSMRVN